MRPQRHVQMVRLRQPPSPDVAQAWIVILAAAYRRSVAQEGRTRLWQAFRMASNAMTDTPMEELTKRLTQTYGKMIAGLLWTAWQENSL